ncbi:hypothetical protein [Streptomyces cyaneofuscatus]
MITVHLKYEIDAEKLDDFEEYGRLHQALRAPFLRPLDGPPVVGVGVGVGVGEERARG